MTKLALNTRLFHNLYSNMYSGHQELLIYTEVWWSKGNVLNHFLDLNVEIEFQCSTWKFQW